MPLDPPKQVRAAGGVILYCSETVVLNLSVETAAGPVCLDDIECLVPDADEDELLMEAPTLAGLGIDLDIIECSSNWRPRHMTNKKQLQTTFLMA